MAAEIILQKHPNLRLSTFGVPSIHRFQRYVLLDAPILDPTLSIEPIFGNNVITNGYFSIAAGNQEQDLSWEAKIYTTRDVTSISIERYSRSGRLVTSITVDTSPGNPIREDHTSYLMRDNKIMALVK